MNKLTNTTKPFNKIFGFFFGFIFLILAIYNLFLGSQILGLCFILSSLLLYICAFFKPSSLSMFNNFWYHFGYIIGNN